MRISSFINYEIGKDEILTSHNTLLRMTEKLDEIVIPHKELLASTDMIASMICSATAKVLKTKGYNIVIEWVGIIKDCT